METNNSSDPPKRTEFQDIGRDHARHRTSRAWLKEAFGVCLVSFALSTYDVASGFVRTGYPTLPGLLSLMIFSMTIVALRVAFRSLGPNSTLAEHRRRTWRIRLSIAASLAIALVVVGGVGQIVRIAVSLNNPV